MRDRSSLWALFWSLCMTALFALGCSSNEQELGAAEVAPTATEVRGEEVAGTSLPPTLTPIQQHLHQALVALAVEDVADAHHHVMHVRAYGLLDAGDIIDLLGPTPRSSMPPFREQQISDGELEALVHFIDELGNLKGGAHLHSEVPPAELLATVEMHLWMALEALEAGFGDDAIHHVIHRIELLEEGEPRKQLDAVLVSLRAGNAREPMQEIEEMLAGTAAPDLTLKRLHLRQALAAPMTDQAVLSLRSGVGGNGLALGDVADAQHHVLHFQESASPEELDIGSEILDLLGRGDLREAEHKIQELLGEEDRED